jgi:hypothetical protein
MYYLGIVLKKRALVIRSQHGTGRKIDMKTNGIE